MKNESKLEIEVKVLNINPEDIRQRLKKIGALHKETVLQRNQMYDYPDHRLYETQDGSYVRLRQIINLANSKSKGLLTHKKTISRQKYKIAEEIESSVGDLKAMDTFLKEMGLIQTRLDEKVRESYSYKNICIEIDEWAGMPPYLEVEGQSEADVEIGLKALGFKLEESTSMNLREVLNMYKIEADTLCFANFGRNIEAEYKVRSV